MANNKSGTKNWYKIKLPDLTHTLSFNDSQLAQFLTHNLVFLDPYDQSYRKLNSAFVYEVLQLVFASCIEYDWDISALDIGAVVDELCTNHYVDLVTSFLPSLVGCGMREFVGSLVSKSGHPTSNTDQDVAVINQVFLKPVVYSFVHCIFSKFGTSGNSGKSSNFINVIQGITY
ncbi:hypothetical protein AX774_g4846 [Zancudomyces culisetae]|uniref:Uncharacterized protein n=1 Tax=Zancudomyces culisetae TaxID=1213189 RepID=A0A1R1PL81_ZANCU|nr:hypothetical protein AX774_g4846 [Zancudomyces culisetae]|eukprot:OMH81697.1 hypothetical protein AX774_g4846 [Zancudomyces culisetae]